MDIGALPPLSTKGAEPEFIKMLRDLGRAMKGIQKQLGRLEKASEERANHLLGAVIDKKETCNDSNVRFGQAETPIYLP